MDVFIKAQSRRLFFLCLISLSVLVFLVCKGLLDSFKVDADTHNQTFVYLLSNYVTSGSPGIKGYAPSGGTVIDLATDPAYTPDYIIVDLRQHLVNPMIEDPLDNLASQWTQEDLNSVRNGIYSKTSGLVDTKILAYFEIGAIEEYRPEADYVFSNNIHYTKSGGQTVNGYPNSCSVGGYSDEAYVKFGSDLPGSNSSIYDKWLNHVLHARIVAAINAGFDGAYLDMTTSYEEVAGVYDSSTRCDGYVGNSSELTDRNDYGSGSDVTNTSEAMRTLIKDVSDKAKAIKEDFLIVPQNSPELFDNRIGYYYFSTEDPPNNDYYDYEFLSKIDGIAIEDSFSQEDSPYRPCENNYTSLCEDWQQNNYWGAKNMKDESENPNFFVLAVDYDVPGVGNTYSDPINYTGNDNGINDYAKDVYSKGMVPYLSTRYTAPGGNELGYIYPLPYAVTEPLVTGTVDSVVAASRSQSFLSVYDSPFITSIEEGENQTYLRLSYTNNTNTDFGLPTLMNDVCTSLTLLSSGDGDNSFEQGETWVYRCIINGSEDVTNSSVFDYGGVETINDTYSVQYIEPTYNYSLIGSKDPVSVGENFSYTFNAENTSAADDIGSLSVDLQIAETVWIDEIVHLGSSQINYSCVEDFDVSIVKNCRVTFMPQFGQDFLSRSGETVSFNIHVTVNSADTIKEPAIQTSYVMVFPYSGSGSLSITRNFLNVAPVAVDDGPFSTFMNTPFSYDGSLMDNDSDPNGDDIWIDSYSQPSNGSVELFPDGSFTYSPQTDWIGNDYFDYTITDGDLVDTARVYLIVTESNDPPVANDDHYYTSEDVSVTFITSVLENDIDPDLDGIYLVSNTQPQNGSVTMYPDGRFHYQPDSDWFGVDSFFYTISDGEFEDSATVYIHVSPVNDAPVINTQSSIVSPANQEIVLSVSIEDDGDPNYPDLTISWTVVTLQPGATLSLDQTSQYNPKITVSAPGNYVVRIHVTDGDLFDQRDIEITATAHAPQIIMPLGGQFLRNVDPVILTAEVIDNDSPTSALSYNWSVISLNSAYGSFSDRFSKTTSFSAEVSGQYQLRFTATDEFTTSIGYVNVTMVDNVQPVVNNVPSGIIKTASDGVVSFNITVVDETIPKGSSLSYLWSTISGPAAVIFSNIHALNPYVTFSADGNYVLRLTVSDGNLQTINDLSLNIEGVATRGDDIDVPYDDETNDDDTVEENEGESPSLDEKRNERTDKDKVKDDSPTNGKSPTKKDKDDIPNKIKEDVKKLVRVTGEGPSDIIIVGGAAIILISASLILYVIFKKK